MFGHFGTNDEKPKAPYALVVVLFESCGLGVFAFDIFGSAFWEHVKKEPRGI